MDTVIATDKVITAQAYQAVVEERIAELLRFRAWYRDPLHSYTIGWPSRWENDAELRALVRLARAARGLSRPVVERADPYLLGWTEAEARFAHGDR